MACKLLAWIPGSTSLGLGCTAVTFLGGFEAKRLSAAAKATWLPRKAGLKSSGMCKLFSCQETEFPPLKWWDRVLELQLRVLNSKEGCSFSNSLRVPWNTNTEGGATYAHPDSTWVNIQGDLRAAPSAFILVVLASLLILLWDDPEGSWKRQGTITDSVVVERMSVFFGKLLPVVKASHIQSIVSDSLKPPGL